MAPSLNQPSPAIAPPPRRRSLYPYAWIAPALAFLSLATLLPIIFTIYISFTNYNGTRHFQSYSFVGWRNYGYAFSTDDLTGYAHAYGWLFGWTVVFAAACTALNIGVGLLLAVLVNNKKLPGRMIFRALLILPWALPFFIAATTWQGILNTDFGAINSLLHALGLGKPDWLNDPNLAKMSLILINVWFSFPFFMVTCLGILQSIPGDLYEAGQIDGAGVLARFRHITLPSIRPALSPILVAQFAFQFNNALIVYAITQGGPPTLDSSGRGETDILASYLYKLVGTTRQFSQAAALGVLVFILIMVLSIVNVRLTGAFKEAK